jgi:hypothetical protein
VVVDDNLSGFNPASSSTTRDFGFRVEHAYHGSVIDAARIPADCHEMAPNDADATVTITFDYSTGVIEKAMSLNVAEVAKADLRAEISDGAPCFYMTRCKANLLFTVCMYVHMLIHFLTKGPSKNLQS